MASGLWGALSGPVGSIPAMTSESPLELTPDGGCSMQGTAHV